MTDTIIIIHPLKKHPNISLLFQNRYNKYSAASVAIIFIIIIKYRVVHLFRYPVTGNQ